MMWKKNWPQMNASHRKYSQLHVIKSGRERSEHHNSKLIIQNSKFHKQRPLPYQAEAKNR